MTVPMDMTSSAQLVSVSITANFPIAFPPESFGDIIPKRGRKGKWIIDKYEQAFYEENIRGILDYCIEAGVKGIIHFGMGVTLRDGNREYFYAQLDKKFPGLKEQYIRTYGNVYEVPSPNNRELSKLFHDTCEAHGIWHDNAQIFRYMGQFEDKADQLRFF